MLWLSFVFQMVAKYAELREVNLPNILALRPMSV